jgi:hypothetical protein
MIDAARLINDTLLLTGYAAFGDSPDPEASLLASRVLNDMLQEWSAEGYINPIINTMIFDMPDNPVDEFGSTTYITVGSNSPTFDIPEEIMDLMTVKVQIGPIVYNLQQISYEEYTALSLKNIPGIPRYYTYDYQFGTGKIHFHLQGLSGYQVIVVYRPRIMILPSNQGNIPLDPLYREALIYNLATRVSPYLAPAGGLDQTIIYHAQHSLKVIKQRNQRATSKKVRPAFYSSGKGSSYWTSPLNSVNTGN